MHEFMGSVTYEEDGEKITYASPTAKDNPWKGELIAGFRGPDQVKRAEEWMHHWSEASGDRQEREELMKPEYVDIPLPPEELKAYLDHSIPLAQKERIEQKAGRSVGLSPDETSLIFNSYIPRTAAGLLSSGKDQEDRPGQGLLTQ